MSQVGCIHGAWSRRTLLCLALAVPAAAQAPQPPAASPATPAAASAEPAAIVITRSGARPSGKGPVEHFTGAVRIDPLFLAKEPSRTLSSCVTFEPGARTAWHTHPLGQRLVVLWGCGLVQRWGGPVEEIRPGDVVWIPPGVKHWHGATPTTAMTHIAIHEQLNGKAVDWLEKVSDEQYQAFK